jgi:hypothetical protein
MGRIRYRAMPVASAPASISLFVSLSALYLRRTNVLRALSVPTPSTLDALADGFSDGARSVCCIVTTPVFAAAPLCSFDVTGAIRYSSTLLF